MKKLLLSCSFVALFSHSAFGVKEFYSLSKSIRSMGMGGAFFGLSDDEYALFSNPAGLSLRKSGTEVMLRMNGHVSGDAISSFNKFKDIGGASLKEKIQALDETKGKPLYANIGALPYFVTKNLGVGILIADTKLNFNISKGSAEVEKAITDSALPGGGGTAALQALEIADMTFISDSGLVIGYAQSFADPGLHIGANLKGLFRAGGRKGFTAAEYQGNSKIDIDPKQIGGYGIGIDLDLGATYEMYMLPFGVVSRASVVLSNLLATEYSMGASGRAPRQVRTANLGWATVFNGYSFVDNFNVLLDISNIPLGGESNPDLGARNTGSFFKKVNFGVEAPIGRLALRAGLNQGYLSAGFGVNLYAARIDFATYAEETGDATRQGSRRYALSAAIGWGSAPPAPIASPSREKVMPEATQKSEVPGASKAPSPSQAPAANPVKN